LRPPSLTLPLKGGGDYAALVAFTFKSRWIALAGAVLLVAVAADSLVPVSWQVRTGLHWLIEHFLAYFAVTFLLCLALPRPFVVAASLMVLAGAMEALQGLTADRIPDLPTAFCGAAGVLAAALMASLVSTRKGHRAGSSWFETRPPAAPHHEAPQSSS
jgi:VanZ family protein